MALLELFLSFTFVALAVLYVLRRCNAFLKRISGKQDEPHLNSNSLQAETTTEKMKVRTVKRFRHFRVSMPFLDGLYSLYLLRKYGVDAVDSWTDKMGQDDLFEIPVGPYLILVSKDAAVLQKVICSSESGHLSRPQSIYGRIFVDILEKGILRTPYEVWNPQRKVLARAFTFRSFPLYADIMNKQSKNLARELSNLILHNSGHISGEKLMECIHMNTVKITLEFIMGSKFSGCEDATQFANVFWELKEIVMNRLLSPMYYLPFVWWLHPKRKRYEMILQQLKAIGKTIIDHYENQVELENEGEQAAINRCLIEEMVKNNVPQDEIIAEIGSFLAAGNDSIGSSMSLIMHHLACYPEYQARCRAEVDKVMSQCDDLKLEDLSKLEYLERFIMESLRIHPPVPFALRELNTPLELDDGCVLEKGTIVNLSPWVIHRNSKYYRQPKVFDPDRFLPEEMKRRDPGTFLPFSGGLRSCIGRRFAILELKSLLAWILRNFEISTEDGLHDVRLFLEASLRPEREFKTTIKMRNPLDDS